LQPTTPPNTTNTTAPVLGDLLLKLGQRRVVARAPRERDAVGLEERAQRRPRVGRPQVLVARKLRAELARARLGGHGRGGDLADRVGHAVVLLELDGVAALAGVEALDERADAHKAGEPARDEVARAGRRGVFVFGVWFVVLCLREKGGLAL
jgi:hypothetical protein